MLLCVGDSGNITYKNKKDRRENADIDRAVIQVLKRQPRSLLWHLNFSDSKHSVLDVADRSRMPFDVIHRAAKALKQNQLLKERE
jgi:aminopeptidase-like protein